MMKAFMILCLSAAALGAPSYNYQQPLSGGVLLSGSSSLGATSFSNVGQNYYGNVESQGYQGPIITKHFHSFDAPEEQEDEQLTRTINLGPSRKHYRVVFIKAPSQSSHATALQIAQAANEEKTVIYVLSKKTDAAEISANIQDIPHNPSKPEVFFIKYKTPEEAHHAQRTIQAQYDHLGGTSQVIDEGIAPISSVIGSFGSSVSTGGSAVSISNNANFDNSGAYLPPN